MPSPLYQAHQLAVQRYRLYTYSHRVFSVTAPATYNSLPDGLQDPELFPLLQVTAEDDTFF